jgi:TPR repeat protein
LTALPERYWIGEGVEKDEAKAKDWMNISVML